MSDLRSERAVSAPPMLPPQQKPLAGRDRAVSVEAPRKRQPQTSAPTCASLLAATRAFAEELAARPNLGETAAPLDDLKRMAELGLFIAPLPSAHGGLGLGVEPGTHLPLLRILAAVGGGDLVLGRLYEGHVNALILIAAFGTPQQVAAAADDARAGMLFGVWNTGGREPLRLTEANGVFTFAGSKEFASGAAFVKRPIVTAELEGKGWQMTVPRMESPSVARAAKIDRSFWHPFGMEASESFAIDFTGATIPRESLIGRGGDFYRNPLFLGGAIRFAAVHAGAILRLQRMFAEALERHGRGGDPYQIARLGEITIGAQEAVLWIERAAAVAEDCLAVTAGKLATERMIETANMTRLAIERIATAMMPRIIAGVGAHGLLRPGRFERILRDLTMYLRQPAPDQALAEVGRAALRRSNLRADGAGNGLWRESGFNGSLPSTYFEKIYDRNLDPWDFEKSDYEAGKYRATIASLPRKHYDCGLEIGCSIGVLTRQIAPFCGSLLGVDVSEKALAAAADRCRDLPQVRFARYQIPQQTIEGEYDLIVVSEVAYYWQREDLERAMTMLAEHQPTGGHLALVHYTQLVPDYPLTGDEVHEAWLARPEWRRIEHSRAEKYRIDVLERR